ncbi:hypothetical protein [Aeromicrobium duanguangcaii]|uniref:Secreted protein n=1 Tax=Aeromicrobium duanguangcaii TaxID=2968086 RepID=A0ABY5KDW3_9ACTN|nr:hypothetical protein [Aeromicrobium duanguangcaii]MCD9154617.1 hypothetical protein [Aeromicrobium duanguangcaii]MCL3838735.1 hypothetical protein [Aeromicrobium duanguangcaii]UUI67968.1 hypothetical protein NP095_12260 [Aeromicrobium duanguangcaii]
MSLARVITPVTAALLAVVVTATPASADTAPDTWDQGETLSFLEWVAIFIGGTLALFIVIALIAAAINTKSKHYVPPTPAEEATKSDHDIEATHRMPLPGAATETKPDADATK